MSIKNFNIKGLSQEEVILSRHQNGSNISDYKKPNFFLESLKKLVQQSSKTVSAKTALLKRINKLTDDLQSPAQKVTAIKYILKNGDEQMVKVINKLIKDQSENTIKLLNKTIDDNRPMIKNWIEDG